MQVETPPALIVDLDGTLVRTDLLLESILQVGKRDPLGLVVAIGRGLTKGLAVFKGEVFRRASIQAHLLPYRPSVVAFAKARAAEGAAVVLATASHESVARSVADHLGFFSAALGSTGDVNMKGRRKLAAIEAHLGGRSFSYMGDSWVDLPLWRASVKPILVNPSPALMAAVRRFAKSPEVLRDPAKSKVLSLAKACRVHQWVKNLLVFVPLLGAHRADDPVRLRYVGLSFVAFCFVASAIYIVNDMLDLDSDREHHRKKRRPFAAGDLAVPLGVVTASVLLVAGFALSTTLPTNFFYSLTAYSVLTSLYSFYLKRVLLLDVICLAALYTLRIFAGGGAAEVPVSKWLLTFSLFFFFGLAMAKRYVELEKTSAEGKLSGRSYNREDRQPVMMTGIGSGYLSLLVIALYITSSDVALIYRSAERLWFLLPLMLYWISRIWIFAARGTLHDDPVVFAIKDRVSYVVLALSVVCLRWAL